MSDQAPTMDQPDDPLTRLSLRQFDRVHLWLILVFVGIAVGAGAVGGIRYLTGVFLREQDLMVAGLVLIGGFVIGKQISRVPDALPVKLWGIAAGTFALAVAGHYLVFLGYPLSMDEFWAVTDGEIALSGAPMAEIPAQWLPYAEALQPIFLRFQPEAGVWSSTYLPLNAVLQALGGPLASPIMALASVFLVADVARRLFPDQSQAPLIAALLLATSAQFLVTAMTPYSMTAHLMLDLLWLWLFIKRRWWAYAASLVVAAFAMGLHQAAFFPLFAMPFLLERFLGGQRILPVAYTAVLGALFLAWSSYDLWAYGWFGVGAPDQVASGSNRAITDLLTRLADIKVESLALMGANLARFVLWQNPIAVPLVVLAAWPVVTLANGAPRELRAMLLSIVGTSLFMLLVIPYQGHGWGYRYLHGQIAGVVLIATFALGRLMSGELTQTWRRLFVGLTILALCILPVRAWQAHSFTAPYANAHFNIGFSKEGGVVVVDAPGHAFTIDLVRNDPFLKHSVKRLAASRLSRKQLAELCERYSVEFYTDQDASRAGIPKLPDGMQAKPRFPDGCPR